MHTVALKQNGTVVAWGRNTGWVGENLGTAAVPANLRDIVSLSARGDNTVALNGDGRVVVWGSNYGGQTNVPPGLSHVAAIASGNYHVVALKQDGTVVAWGGINNGIETRVPEELSGVTAIAAGSGHTVALKGDGTVVAWGINDNGQANVPRNLRNVAAIAAGSGHTITLTRDGIVVGWGNNRSGQANAPSDLRDVSAIAAGDDHSIALKRDGTVVAWGNNSYGQLDVPPGLRDVIAIAAGGRHTVALRRDGTIEAWGLNYYGQAIAPANRSDLVAISAKGGEPYFSGNKLALQSNGRVAAWGDNAAVPGGLGEATQIAAGWIHSLALKRDGTVTGWIMTNIMHLGPTDPTVPDFGQAVAPAGLRNVAAIAAGKLHSVALKQDGTVEVWGRTTEGQANVPSNLRDVVAIAAGNSHTLALTRDGIVVAWGNNPSGQTNVPANLRDVSAIAAGDAHSVALKRDGTLVTWGNNRYGQLDVPPDLSDVTAISAGNAHTVALKGDGTVVAWGQNANGQTNVPPGLSKVLAIAAGGDYTLALVEVPVLSGTASHVLASQRPGTTLVDLFYDLNGVGSDYYVSVAVSSNGGFSFTIPKTHFSGDGVTSPAAPGTARHIVWDAGQTLPPGTFGSNFKARVAVTSASGAMSPAFAVEVPGPGTTLNIQGRALDAQTGQPLLGATVSIGGRSVVTTGSGNYAFDDIPLTAASTLTIINSDRSTHTESLYTTPGTRQVVVPDVRLNSESATGKPTITSLRPQWKGIFLHGLGLANGYAATVNWNGGTPGSVQFYANDQSAGSFTGAGPTFTTIQIDPNFRPSLREGVNQVQAMAISANGAVSAPVSVGLPLIPVPAVLRSGLESFAIHNEAPEFQVAAAIHFPEPPVTADLSLGVLGRFGFEFTAEAAFDYDLPTGEWEATFGLNTDGVRNRRGRRPALPGLTRSKTLKLYLGKKEIEGDLLGGLRGIATAETGVRLEDVFGRAYISARLEVWRLSPLDLFGPGVTEALDWIPGLTATLNDLSVPIYAEPEIEGDVNFAWEPTLHFRNIEMTGSLGIEAAYEPKIGSAELTIAVGGQPSLSLQYPGSLFKEVRFKCYASIEAKAWMFKFGPHEVVLVDFVYPDSSAFSRLNPVAVSFEHPEKSKLISREYLEAGGERFMAETDSKAKRAYDAAQALEDFRIIGRTSRPIKKKQGLGGESVGRAQADLPLLKNVYPGSAPALASRGANLILLYVADNGVTNDLQFTDIRWTHFDGTNWTIPAAIVADTRAESAPQVVFDGNGDAIAVWERVADPDFNLINLTSFSSKLEIVGARWDHSTKQWSEPQALTVNSHLDHEPLLCGPMANGDVLLVWTQNIANQLIGTNSSGTVGNSDVQWRQWSAVNHMWSASQPLVTNLAYRLSQSFAGAGNRAVYAWTRDLDGVLGGVTDQQIFFRSWSNGVWSAESQFTVDTLGNHNVQTTVSPDGDIYLLWRAGTNLVFNRNFAATNQLARSDSQTAGFTDCSLTLGPGGNLGLIWQEMSEDGSDAHYRIYDPTSGSWSEDARLFTDAGLERSFAPVWDDVGNLTMAYNKVEILKTNKTLELAGGGLVTISNVPLSGRVDLGIVKRRLVKDVSLLPGSLRVQAENYLPGAALNLETEVHNAGDVAMKDVVVGFYVGDPASGGVLITNVMLSGWLEAGRTETASALWVMPDAGAIQPLVAMADPEDAITELLEANNTQSFSLGGTDLTVTLLSTTVETNGAMRVVAQVKNIGAPAAAVSILALRRDSETNTPLAAASVIALEPGRLAQIAIDVSSGSLSEGQTILWLTADDTAVTGDVHPQNNIVSFVLNRVVDSDGDGLTDTWEAAYNLNPADAADSSLDKDGDGISNLAEYLAGTDPSDSGSYLRMKSVTLDGSGGIQVGWGSTSNRLYSLQRSSDLRVGFTNLVEHVRATPPENTYLDTSATNAGTYFYRVTAE